MAFVVTAAPTDGAPLFALHKLDKCFGATQALKVVLGKRLNPPTSSSSTNRTSAPKRKSIGCWPPLAKGAGVIVASSYLRKVYQRGPAGGDARTQGRFARKHLDRDHRRLGRRGVQRK